MQGQKQIFTFVVILIIICSFTFFRNAIRKDKHFHRLREDVLRKKLESILEDNEHEEPPGEDAIQPAEVKNYSYKLLEYKDICYDLHAIIFKPEREVIINENNGLKTVNEKHGNVDAPTKIEDSQQDTAGQVFDTKPKNSVVTGPVAYVCVIILIYSFIKAATDMSRQLNKKKEDDDSNNRKCSLQEYANNNKRNRRPSRGPMLKRATTVAVEPRMHAKQQSLEERRRSYILPELNHGSGLITEPGTPPKTLNGLATRPPPLLRRCSVPVFALQAGHGSALRRPSVDSYSEDDSSPDVKRRVRMIHRH